MSNCICTYKWTEKLIKVRYRNAPPAVKVEEQESKQSGQSPQVLLQEIIEKEKYDGCSLLTKTRGSTLWYVCSKKENSHKPSFYNYNRARKEPKSKVMKVDSFTTRLMTFDDKSTESLRLSPFFWMGKLSGGALIPEKECNFKEMSSGNNPSYILTCKDQEVQTGIQLEKITQTKRN